MSATETFLNGAASLFNVNGSGGVCFYLQAVLWSVSVKIQNIAINGSVGVCDGACLYFHAMVVCFSKDSGLYYNWQ